MGDFGDDVALDGGAGNVDLVGKLAINKKTDRGHGSLRKHSGRALEPAKKLWRKSVFEIWGIYGTSLFCCPLSFLNNVWINLLEA